MNADRHLSRLAAIVAGASCLGAWACGSTATRRDASTATGGVPALGGSVGGPAMDAPIGAGGATSIGLGTGGVLGTGARAATGGGLGNGGATRIGTGGSYLDGGAPGGRIGTGGTHSDGGVSGSGGRGGTGGLTGTGGVSGIDAGSRTLCGGGAAPRCPTGQFCDIIDHCGMVTDGVGLCVPTGASVVCDTVIQPVCGCDGKTYPSDCERGAAGMSKFSDGECVAGRDGGVDVDEQVTLGWQAKVGGARTGPAIMVAGPGFYAVGTDVGGYRDLLTDGSPSYGLSIARIQDLFARLAAIDLTALPHASTAPVTCTAELFVRSCGSCQPKTLTYASAVQLAPELEPIWAWFDEVLGSPTAATNPRSYCNQ